MCFGSVNRLSLVFQSRILKNSDLQTLRNSLMDFQPRRVQGAVDGGDWKEWSKTCHFLNARMQE